MPADSNSSSIIKRDAKASLREVRVSEQVLQSCLRHAFTTEKEEVMGLLLGQLEPLTASSSSPNAADRLASYSATHSSTTDMKEERVAHIWATHVSERNVQRSDRVEMSSESLASAADAAEAITLATGVPTMVLGWYHSHPKIPVVPSAVDLQTQRTFQLHVESGWVGLIVSLFNTESSLHRSHCALHCFQAGPDYEEVPIPVHVVPQASLFVSPAPLAALPDTTDRLLRVLRKEVCSGVADVAARTRHDTAAGRAARGLAEMQLYEVDRLIAEPTRKELQLSSLPLLRAEVARLEKELASQSAAVQRSSAP